MNHPLVIGFGPNLAFGILNLKTQEIYKSPYPWIILYLIWEWSYFRMSAIPTRRNEIKEIGSKICIDCCCCFIKGYCWCSYKEWPHRGSSQSVAYLRCRAMTLKLTGTHRQTDGQDHVLSQADALTNKGSAARSGKVNAVQVRIG